MSLNSASASFRSKALGFGVQAGGGEESIVGDDASLDGGHKLKEFAQLDLSVAVCVHFVQEIVHLVFAQTLTRSLQDLDEQL